MSPKHPPVHIDERAINVFADGSSYSGPRRGGIGYRIVVVDDVGHEVVHDYQPAGYRGGTNQEMELMACIEALRLIAGRHSPVDVREYTKIVIYTDSIYVADNFAQAKFTWPTTKWRTRDGNPVVNAKLWKDLVSIAHKTGTRVDIVWHKGHSSSNPHNKAVDKIAKNSAMGSLRKPVSISRVRRKQTGKSTEAGSIKAEGQRLTVRVITDRWLPVQRTYVYKYEVISRHSPYRGNVDTIYSDIMLNAGHMYFVRLNDDPARPRIEKVFRELLAKPR